MKIEQIDLKAYGHFSNQQLRLSGPSDFHIICGPNEAGKTTLWRAINGALFGIPNVSPDTFLHESKKIRIGLILSARSGERLAVMRRKGRINTLLKYDPATGNELADSVPDERLRDWLGGLSEGLFLAMFSLDHAALLRGGVALAQGRGDAGESLFEAGAGLSSIRSLRARLDREAETLFKPRASTSVVYRTLADYEEARKQAKDAAVRPTEWTAARTTMELASKAYEAARVDQLRLQKEARRLERLAAILPDVAALGLAQQRLAELAGIPPLPPSAAAERIAAVTKRNAAVTAERTASLRLAQRQGELAAIQVNDAVLADAESIEAIHHATTAYREAGVSSATATAAIATAQAALTAILQQIAGDARPDEALQWIPNPIQAARIRSLITTGATIKARHASDLKALGEKQLAIAQLDAELLSLGTDGADAGLGPYLDSIADHGDPQAQAQQLERDAVAATVKLNAEAGALKMPSADAVAKWTVPLEAEVQRFKSDDEELRRQARSIRETMEKIEDDLAALRGQIEGMQIRGDVPTKEAVSVERAKRNELWLGIRRRFMPAAGESIAADPPPSAERYEHAVSNADDAADGLFADAERATRYAEFRVRKSQMENALGLERGRAEEIAKNQAAIRQRWAELLAGHGMPAVSIAEAGQWIAKRDAFLQKFDAIQLKRQEAQQRSKLAQEICTRITAIFQAMKLPPPAATERLSEILARARAIAKQHADQMTQRALKKSARATAEVASRHAETAESRSREKADDWWTQWREAMLAIRLEPDASAEEATARLEQFAALEEAHAALNLAGREQREARIRISDYETRLAGTWQRVRGAPIAADGRTHELLAGELYRELRSSRSLQETRSTLTKQLVDDQAAVDEARQTAADATAIIERLLLQAACITLESLELVEEQSMRRSALAGEIRDIETRLVQSAGLPLPEALQQAEAQDPDAIAAALDQNLQKNEEMAAKVQKRHEEYLAARQVFDAMDGSATAADAQQKTAQHAARIAELSADYAASRIASAVLAQVIDTYQKRNQGPLIAQASRRFAAITAGRFSGVVIDYEEERQILKAVRADGERLTMEQLSTGRRDQLFLALRLAAIEGHLDNGEPLPVIIDDILIQFDDAASAATFQVLAELSRRTQVLFLTHHEHLLEVAEVAIGGGAYSSHALSS